MLDSPIQHLSSDEWKKIEKKFATYHLQHVLENTLKTKHTPLEQWNFSSILIMIIGGDVPKLQKPFVRMLNISAKDSNGEGLG